jgi:tetratricopeptide (TPR) repeat protein
MLSRGGVGPQRPAFAAAQPLRDLLPILVTVLLPACSGLPAAAVEQVRRAQDHYDAGRGAQAESLLAAVIAGHPGTNGIEQAYYLRGLCRSGRGDLRGAREDFTRTLDAAAASALRCQAHAQLGHLDYRDEDYQAAADHYSLAAVDLPLQAPSDVVYYQYGDSLQKTGAWDQSRALLARVWHVFPESGLVEAARRKFSWPHDYMTIECGGPGPAEQLSRLAAELTAAGHEARVEYDLNCRPPAEKLYVGRFERFAAARPVLLQVLNRVPDAAIVP